MTERRFLRFYYSAIKRYGDKRWTANSDVIEFNPNYTVSVSGCEKGDFECGKDKPYIVELSNGTKFLCFFHDFGDGPDDEILSVQGESANTYVGDDCAKRVAKNISKLNNIYG